jgi:hypothetical protein
MANENQPDKTTRAPEQKPEEGKPARPVGDPTREQERKVAPSQPE